MAKLLSSGATPTGKSHFPCVYTHFVLGILGAVPISFRKPYFPNRNLRESTFLYCVIFYGLTLWTCIVGVMFLSECMESAYPYNHFRFIAAFELLVYHLFNFVTPVAWMDTSALFATMDAWGQFIDKYENCFRRPIPNCKAEELLLQILIIVATPTAFFCGASLLESEIQWEWKYVPNIIFPAIIEHTFILQWVVYCWTVEKVAKELAKHLREVSSEKHLITHKVLQEYRALWILLRNITETISIMTVPLCICLFDFILSTLSIVEGILLYSKTNNLLLTVFNLSISLLAVVPLIFMCTAGHNATDRVQYLFEELMVNLDLSSLSKTAQKELCMIYLVKQAKKPLITLSGFSDLNLSFLLSVVSSISMNVLIFIQFQQIV